MVVGIVIVLATIVAGYFFVRWQKTRQARQAVIDRRVAQGDLTGVTLDIEKPPELERDKQQLIATRQAWWKGAARKDAPYKSLLEELEDLPNVIDRLLRQNQFRNEALLNYSTTYYKWEGARKTVNEFPNPEAEGKHTEWYDSVIKLRLKQRKAARAYYEAREAIGETVKPVTSKFYAMGDILSSGANYDLSALPEETKLAVETAARLTQKLKPDSYHHHDSGPRIDAEPEEPNAEAEALCRRLETLNRQILIAVRKCQRLQSMVAERAQSYDELVAKPTISLPTKPAEDEVGKLIGGVSDWAKNVLDREAELKMLLSDLAECERDIQQGLAEVNEILAQLAKFEKSISLREPEPEPDWRSRYHAKRPFESFTLGAAETARQADSDPITVVNASIPVAVDAATENTNGAITAIGDDASAAKVETAVTASGDKAGADKAEAATTGNTVVAAPRRSWWWGENTAIGNTTTGTPGFGERRQWEPEKRGKAEVTTPKAFEHPAKWFVTDQAQVLVEASGCVQALADHAAKAGKEVRDKYAGFALRERPEFTPADESKRDDAQAATRKLGFAIAQLIYATTKTDALSKEKDQPVQFPSGDITDGNTFIQAYGVMMAQNEALKKRQEKRKEQLAALQKQHPERVQQQAAACETLFTTLDDNDMLEEGELPAALCAVSKAARALLSHCQFKERMSKRTTARRAEAARRKQEEDARKAEQDRIAHEKALRLMRIETIWVGMLSNARLTSEIADSKQALEAEASARSRFKKAFKSGWRVGSNVQLVIGPPGDEQLMEFSKGISLSSVLHSIRLHDRCFMKGKPVVDLKWKVKHKAFVEIVRNKGFAGIYREPGEYRVLEIPGPNLQVEELLKAVAEMDAREGKGRIEYSVLLKGKPITESYLLDGAMVELVPIPHDGQQPEPEPVMEKPVAPATQQRIN